MKQNSRPGWRLSKGAVAVALVLAGCGAPISTTPPSHDGSAPSNTPRASSLGPSAAASSDGSAALGRLPTGRIVFDRLHGNPEGDFEGAFTVGTDGVESELALPIAAGFFTAVWSPDGRELLVSSYSPDTGSAVGTLEIASGRYTPLPNKEMASEISCSDWTPDMRTVICSRAGKDPASDEIYTVAVATGAARRITHSRFHDTVGSAGECGGGDSRAVYAPDGTRFAYIQQKCGTGPDPSSDEQGAVYVAKADGSASNVVVPFGDVRTHPGGLISWSPTGNTIAFGSQDGRLSLIGADGTGLREIDLADAGRAYGPTWSPDGNWILATIVSSADGNHDLYAIAPDGSTKIRLTTSAEAEAYADWTAVP